MTPALDIFQTCLERTLDDRSLVERPQNRAAFLLMGWTDIFEERIEDMQAVPVLRLRVSRTACPGALVLPGDWTKSVDAT